MTTTQYRNVRNALIMLFVGILIGWLLRSTTYTPPPQRDRVYTSENPPVIVSLGKSEGFGPEKQEQELRKDYLQKYLTLASLYINENKGSVQREVTKGVIYPSEPYPSESSKDSIKAIEAASYRTVEFDNYMASAKNYLSKEEILYLKGILKENPLGLRVPENVAAEIKEARRNWVKELTPDFQEIDFQSAFTSTDAERRAVYDFLREFLKKNGVLFEEYHWE